METFNLIKDSCIKYPNEKEFNKILGLYHLINKQPEKAIKEFEKLDIENDI
jgi:hypothetical protein